MQQPIGGVQFFTNSDDRPDLPLGVAWSTGFLLVASGPRAEGLELSIAQGTLQYVPDSTLSVRNIEFFTGGLFGLASDLLGHEREESSSG